MTDLILILSTILGLFVGPSGPSRDLASEPPPAQKSASAPPTAPDHEQTEWRETTSSGVVRHCGRTPVYGYRGAKIGEVRRCF